MDDDDEIIDAAAVEDCINDVKGDEDMDSVQIDSADLEGILEDLSISDKEEEIEEC